MNKILKRITPFLIILIVGCGYKPLLKNNNLFSINNLNLDGDTKINQILSNSFYALRNNKKENNYDLNIQTEQNKIIISKDSKGDPLIYEIIVKIDFKVIQEEEILLEKNLTKKNSYNNLSDKLDLEKYEDDLIYNLINNVYDDIVFSISNLN
tara:strand:- start:44 stop:502 length:459 start_codon:yes stop_codon:yes gene_type:complete